MSQASGDAPLLEIDDLCVLTEKSPAQPPAEVLTDVSLQIRAGEVHALMGPNGCGNSILANALLGAPGYEVTSGRIAFKGDDITNWATDVRAKVGIFLAFAEPQEIAGVSVLTFLRQSLSARTGIDRSVRQLRQELLEWMELLGMERSFLDRYLNEGFSADEKRQNEILQLAILEPELAILDETDAELSVDTRQFIARSIQLIRQTRPELGSLVIAQDQRLLDQLQPDHVHIMIDGKITTSGGAPLTEQLNAKGYESFL